MTSFTTIWGHITSKKFRELVINKKPVGTRYNPVSTDLYKSVPYCIANVIHTSIVQCFITNVRYEAALYLLLQSYRHAKL